jgi:hypothetical protein
MLQRCYDSADVSCKNYGKRGIGVCRRWRQSFVAFLTDVGRKPSRQHSLGRIKNNRNYTPSNCRWETRKQQGRNRRGNVWLRVNGQRRTLTDWARRRRISLTLICERLKRGWGARDAVLTPPQHFGYRQKKFDKKEVTVVPRAA